MPSIEFPFRVKRDCRIACHRIKSVAEAAGIDGASEWAIFSRVATTRLSVSGRLHQGPVKHGLGHATLHL
jgi:hypothetical protein